MDDIKLSCDTNVESIYVLQIPTHISGNQDDFSFMLVNEPLK